ncbi:MAG: S8 family serine peptidase [Deltaproteobacteria bacterium]|nr:S8 family serine peptidase [Deltaproteobacteria bacterium]
MSFVLGVGAAFVLAACASGTSGPGPRTDTNADSDSDSATDPAQPYDDLDALQPGDYHPERFLVGLGTARSTTIRLWRSAIVPAREWPELDAAVYEVPAGEDVLDVVRELRKYPEFDYVEPSLRRRASVNDPLFYLQWHMAAIDVEGAWAISDGTGAVVAVIDTGLHLGGNDPPTSVVAGYDFVEDDTDPTDLESHGTHVSGTVAQGTDNGVGVVGVAYGASIMPVRVLDAKGEGWGEDVIAGILFAADNGADVLNLSLGGPPSETEESACDYAVALGATVAAASGNDGYLDYIDAPAQYASVIAVGATGYAASRTPYSNEGAELDLVAPGGNTGTDDNGDGYADGVLQETFVRKGPNYTWKYHFWQGTSMATPHVAGVAALLASLGASNTEIRSILTTTATDLGDPGWDSIYGWGLLNAGAAVAAYVPNQLPVADAGGPYSALVGEIIPFDASGSTDADGTIVSYEWNFLDGTTGTGETVDHAYGSVGFWIAVLTITDNDGGTDSTYTTITVDPITNAPPIAAMNAPYQTNLGTELFFDGTNSLDPDGTVVDWYWNFGDGTTSTGSTASHTYAAAGEYPVALTVTDDLGAADVAVSTATIEPPPNLAPAADAGGPYSGTADVPVSFDGSGSSDSDGSIVDWYWSFGDSNSGTGETPSHAYAAAGTYQVVLTVTDDRGYADVAITSATIDP